MGSLLSTGTMARHTNTKTLLIFGLLCFVPVFEAAIGDLIRLTCKTEVLGRGREKQGFVVCMELKEIAAAGRGLQLSTNDDRTHLDPLVKRINDNRAFTALDFTRNGNAGTLVGDRGGRRNRDNHFRIDTQDFSRDHANIQYQVGDDSKAQCIIRYNPSATPPGYQHGMRLELKFTAGQIKAMVQEGLDFPVSKRIASEINAM